MSDLDVRAICLEHEAVMGVARLNPEGFPIYSTRHRGRASRLLPGTRDSQFVSLRDTSVEHVPAWCPRCREEREVAVAVLLDAVEGRRSKVILL